MDDQLHIRNAEAAQLARTLARQTGKTISEVVLEALRRYRPGRPHPPHQKQLTAWHRLLHEDRRRGFIQPETPIEALYSKTTGLPE